MRLAALLLAALMSGCSVTLAFEAGSLEAYAVCRRVTKDDVISKGRLPDTIIRDEPRWRCSSRQLAGVRWNF